MAAPVSAFDLAIVGAGIVGLAHALAAARRGQRVVVIDRDAQANGASIRNFGFITVTGQAAGATWRRARRSREVWAEVAPRAGIAILQRGLVVTARRPEAVAVLEAFRAGEMGEGCELLGPAAARARFPFLAEPLAAALWSPHELRVESREAIPQLARWLADAHGVTFLRGTTVHAAVPPRLATSAGPIEAGACIVCPGDDLTGLFADRLAAYGLTRCRLQMLRIAPADRQLRLPCAVMSDLSLVRYEGYAQLAPARSLRVLLEREPRSAAMLAHGIHLIVVQSADGSLVVGDSHHYAATPEPFASAAVDRLILEELDAAVRLGPYAVTERWTGTYAAAPDRPVLVDAPAERVRMVVVTSGTGASTAFAIAEEVMAGLERGQAR
jgi:FAD dependent oxidoreductase TIGR03364